MEPGRSRSPAISRREIRESQRTSRRRLTRSTWATWLPRAGVLTALALATIAVPVLEAASPQFSVAGNALVAESYPTAHEVLAGESSQTPSTSLLAAVPVGLRGADLTSRSLDRDPLPGCEGLGEVNGTNGQLPESDLCTLWDGVNKLRSDAAVSLTELNSNFRAAFGRNLCLVDSYRTLAEQRSIRARRGGLAATPETSNHGWGLAIDLCRSETRSEVLSWLSANGEIFGWVNPPWAQRGGAGAYEPWHWEYLPGTREMGTDFSR